MQSYQTWVSRPLPYFALRITCHPVICGCGLQRKVCAELDSQSTKTNFQKMVLVVSHLSTRRLKSGLTEIGQCHRPSPERHSSTNIVVKQPIENFWELFFR